MDWIWQLKQWPNFEYEASALVDLENEFNQNIGVVYGAVRHLEAAHSESLKIEILTQEALSTSSIEGEILQRESVQSSIRKYLGLKTDNRKIPANAAGIAEMMVDVYLNFEKPLTHETLFLWHKMLTNGRRDLESIGNYRNHPEPMQIVSGNLTAPRLFYEAPPSNRVFTEMEAFINWYNAQTVAKGVSVLAIGAIAHLYFEAIHPFEDGNGRIGRALVEKLISQKIGRPAINSFAKVIETNKKAYYEALQACNHDLKIDKWLAYFSKMLIESQRYTIKLVEFLVSKTKFFAMFNDQLNERQLKVLVRVFSEGIEGFKGGLSAANYRTITGTSPATVTRDLQELVNIKALYKTGELKNSRYFLTNNSDTIAKT